MEDDYKNQNLNPKKEMSKIGPKLLKNKQCKKQTQSTALSILSQSKMDQEEDLKGRKLDKASKTLIFSMASNQYQSSNRILEEDSRIGDKEEIKFEETKEHDMEEDEGDCFDDDKQYNLSYDNPNKRTYDEQSRDKQEKYDFYYGSFEDKNIYNYEVDLSNCLKNHKIVPQLRSKMVDWMIEVIANYKQTSSDKTYFRAVCILDLFYKKSHRILKDSDVHLFGIAAMFLATKQEDISHISLDDIVEKVGHNKFQEIKIRQAEFEILNVIDMRTDLPTPYTYLTRFIYKIFSNNQNQSIVELTKFSIYILKQCLHDETLLDYKSHILAFSAIIISIKIYFTTLRGEQLPNCHSSEQLQNQEVIIMFNLINPLEHQNAKDCSTKVKDLFFSFATRYPDLKNLDKFHI